MYYLLNAHTHIHNRHTKQEGMTIIITKQALSLFSLSVLKYWNESGGSMTMCNNRERSWAICNNAIGNNKRMGKEEDVDERRVVSSQHCVLPVTTAKIIWMDTRASSFLSWCLGFVFNARWSAVIVVAVGRVRWVVATGRTGYCCCIRLLRGWKRPARKSGRRRWSSLLPLWLRCRTAYSLAQCCSCLTVIQVQSTFKCSNKQVRKWNLFE